MFKIHYYANNFFGRISVAKVMKCQLLQICQRFMFRNNSSVLKSTYTQYYLFLLTLLPNQNIFVPMCEIGVDGAF